MARAARRVSSGAARRRGGSRVVWLVIGVAIGAGAVLTVQPRSLSLPPLAPPRFMAPRPAHAPVDGAHDAARDRADAGREAQRPPGERQRDPAGDAAPGRVTSPAFARARVAVVIDDLGDDFAAARAVLALDPPVTVAVMPFRPASTRVAALAVERGSEVILHLPLEPEEHSEMTGARGFLEAGMSAGEIERQLSADLGAVPYIVGVNGHMGSRFTSDAARMDVLLRALHARGLFFLDSRTSGASVAAATAARVGVAFAERTLFLDHDPSAPAVAAALTRLTNVARDTGEAIAIGHPHATTITALREWLAQAEGRGIALVPASALVR